MHRNQEIMCPFKLKAAFGKRPKTIWHDCKREKKKRKCDNIVVYENQPRGFQALKAED